MNLVTIGKIGMILIAVLQAVVAACGNGGFTPTNIATIVAALIGAVTIHTGQVQAKAEVSMLKQKLGLLPPAPPTNKGIINRFILLGLCGSLLLTCTACVELYALAAAPVGAGIVLWLEKQPIVQQICYLAGDELALNALPQLNSTAVDKDVVTACESAQVALAVATGQTADQVNALITKEFAGLPPAVLTAIQNGATYLAMFVPAGAVPLTADDVACIAKFVQGIEDGAKTVLSDSPASVIEKRQKVSAKLRSKQAKAISKGKVKTGNKGLYWFVPVAPPATVKK